MLNVNRRQGLLLLGFLMLTISCFIFQDFLTFRRVFLFKDIGSDTINLFYPNLLHIAEYVRRDGLPLWSFGRGMGQNIFSSLGLPLNWLLFSVGPDSLAYAIAYLEVLKIILAGLIFYGFLLRITKNVHACVLGALMYAFSGFMIVGGSWYIFSTNAVYFALLLYGFERYHQDRVWWPFSLGVALIAANNGFYIYFFAVFMVIYAVFRILEERAWTSGDLGQLFVRLTLLGLLGCGLAGIFLISNVEEMLQSHRVGDSSGAVRSELASESPFSIYSAHTYVVTVMRLLSNNLTGVGSQYNGIKNYLEDPLFYTSLLALLLAPMAVLGADRKVGKRYFLLLLVIFLPAIFPYVRHALWLFAGDYYYREYGLFVCVTLILCGIRSLDALAGSDRMNIPWVCATSTILLILLYFPYDSFLHDTIRMDASIRRASTVFLVLYTFTLVAIIWTRSASVIAISLLTLTICTELAFTGYTSLSGRPAVASTELLEKVGYNDYTRDVVRELGKIDPGFYRIEKTYSSGLAMHRSLNDALAQGYYGTSSYHSFNQNNYLNFLDAMGLIGASENRSKRRWINGLITRPMLMGTCSVKYVLIKNPALLEQYKLYGFQEMVRVGDVVAMTNPQYMPMGSAYHAYMSRDDFLTLNPTMKDAVLRTAVVLNPEQEIVLAKGLDKLSLNGLTSAAITGEQKAHSAMAMESTSQNHLAGTFQSGADEVLLFSIPYDSGWKAWVDDRPTDLIPVNVGLTGLPLPPGTHRISLDFRPAYWFIGWSISILSGLIFVGMLFRRSLHPARRRAFDG